MRLRVCRSDSVKSRLAGMGNPGSKRTHVKTGEVGHFLLDTDVANLVQVIMVVGIGLPERRFL